MVAGFKAVEGASDFDFRGQGVEAAFLPRKLVASFVERAFRPRFVDVPAVFAGFDEHQHAAVLDFDYAGGDECEDFLAARRSELGNPGNDGDDGVAVPGEYSVLPVDGGSDKRSAFAVEENLVGGEQLETKSLHYASPLFIFSAFS